MHQHITAIGLWSLTTLLGFAQTPAPPMDYAARVQSVENLKAHIAQRDARFEQQRTDLLALDARAEKQIDDIVTSLAALKDSKDSKTKVANIKGDVMKALMRTIGNYRQKRVDLFERMRKDTSVPKEQLEKNMKVFDDLITKRIAQITELAKSFPGYQDVKKYESDGGSYYRGYYQEDVRISEDWKQNRRNNNSGQVARREVLQELDKAIDRNQSRRDSLAAALESGNGSALQLEELGRIDAGIDNLKTQRRQLVLPGDGATREIGADEAHDTELMLDDARRDLARDYSDIMRKYAELDSERTRISDMKANLAAREEWLQKNPPPAK